MEVVAVVAAGVLQEDEPVAGQIDGFVVDLLVGEVVHRQTQLAGEGLQDLEDAAMQADEGDPGGPSALGVGDRGSAAASGPAIAQCAGQHSEAGAAGQSQANATATMQCEMRAVENRRAYSTVNGSSALSPAFTWTCHLACLTSS